MNFQVKNQTKRFWFAIMLCVMVSSLAACSTATEGVTPSPSPLMTVEPSILPTEDGSTGTDGNTVNPPAQNNGVGTPAENNAAGVMANTAHTLSTQETLELAGRIKNEVEKLSEVDTCHAAVVGSYVIIGVTFDSQYKGALTERISNMVAERAKIAMPGVQQVAVTADAALLDQIQNIGTQFSANTPISEITAGFTTLYETIAPSTRG